MRRFFSVTIPRKYSRPLRRSARGMAANLAFRLGGKPLIRRQTIRLMKTLSGGVGYAAFIEPRWVEITRVDVAIRDLPPQLEDYRIAHLSDIHYTFAAGAPFLEAIVEKANALDPDLVALTGDFIGHNPQNLHRCLALLSDLRAPDGLWACRGNHDHRASLADFQKECREAEIHFLENRHTIIRPSRARLKHVGVPAPEQGTGSSPRLVLAGVGDLWEGVCDLGAALGGLDPSLPTILLSHNPQAAELLTDGQRADLVLSGHTHGGQVKLLGRSFKLFTDGTRKYVSGLVETPRTRVYVSRGVGTSAFRMRWNCRPEIALIHLHRAPGDSEAHVGHAIERLEKL